MSKNQIKILCVYLHAQCAQELVFFSKKKTIYVAYLPPSLSIMTMCMSAAGRRGNGAKRRYMAAGGVGRRGGPCTTFPFFWLVLPQPLYGLAAVVQ
jgi:hypothetical protein